MDKNTSDICRPLNGIVAPVDDKIWNKYSPLNHFNCFVAGTKILLYGAECSIEKINVGDSVVTHKMRTKKVLQTHKNKYSGDIYRFVFSGGSNFECTENHPILTTDGWIDAKNITLEHVFASIEGLKKCKKITKRHVDLIDVYNLSVEDDETYALACKGVIVHNCRCVLEKIDKYESVKQTGKARLKEVETEMDKIVQPEFKMNAGKDGYIFSPKHPYFEVAAKDKALALRNFDLPIPEKD